MAKKPKDDMPREMPTDALAKIDEGINALREFIGKARKAFEKRNERWQQSDAGQAYEAWVEEWEDYVSSVENDQPAEAHTE